MKKVLFALIAAASLFLGMSSAWAASVPPADGAAHVVAHVCHEVSSDTTYRLVICADQDAREAPNNGLFEAWAGSEVICIRKSDQAEVACRSVSVTTVDLQYPSFDNDNHNTRTRTDTCSGNCTAPRFRTPGTGHYLVNSPYLIQRYQAQSRGIDVVLPDGARALGQAGAVYADSGQIAMPGFNN